MEVKQSAVKEQLDIIWRPHPILPAADCKAYVQEWKQGQTVREVLIANGIDQQQPIVIVLDDRLLTVQEWDTICPLPGQLINVKAEVQGGGGGGGGSNVLQIVAMVALVVVAAILAAPTGGASLWLAGAIGTSAATAGMIIGGVVMIAGSLIINAVFAAQMPSADLGNMSGSSSSMQTSPTYGISGGQNRQRPYEPMPVLMGRHVLFFDLASKPFTEYHGEDQYLYQIFHRGLSSATFTDYKIGDNLITNYIDWSWNYADENGQIGAFPGNVDTAPGANLEAAAGWITRTTSINTYKIGVDIEGTMFYANNAGGMDSTSVQIRLQYRAIGSSTWIDPSDIEVSGAGFVDGRYENYSALVSQGYDNYNGEGNYIGWVDTSYYETRTRFVAGGSTVIISGNSQAPRRATLFITPAAVGQYEVRVIRDTADSTDSRLSNKTSWSAIRSYQKDEGYYKGQDRLGLTIRASEQLNGVIQQLSAVGSARANYWNGSAFVFGETSNPAHWFMDFAIGRKNPDGKLMYGVGLSQSQIDFTALHTWAQFCTTEGLSFNGVIDGAQTSADLLAAIARCGFGSPTWASGKLGIIWDGRNQSPVAAFGMSNIIKGSFTVSYITENLAEEIIVKYINPNKDWNQDEVRVNIPGVTNPLRSSTIDLYGCTDQTMAGKFANYIAAQQYYRRRRVTWDCDFEGFVCSRGDVVLLSHDLTQWGYSGRIEATGANTITFDREVPRNGMAEYMMLKKPDGTMTTYTVLPATGNTKTVTLTTEPEFQEGYELLDHIWFFSPLATPGKKVKILSVQPISDSRVQVTATDDYPEFYAAWDGEFTVPPASTLLLDSVPVVKNIRITENIYRGTDDAIKSHVSVIWDTNGVWERANIRYRVGTDAYTKFTTQATKFEFDTQNTGSIDIEILPITGLKVGAPTTFTGTVYGVTATLPDVEGFTDFYRDGRTVLTWRYVTDPRNIVYELRKGTDWERAEVLGTVTNNEFTALGDGTYWIAAKFGSLYSPNPTTLIIEDSLITTNVIATYDEEATGWSGTLSGGAAIRGTDLVLQGTGLFSAISVFSAIPSLYAVGSISTYGEYEIPSAHIVDIGKSQACDINIAYRMAADSPYNLFSAIPVFSEISSLVGVYAGQANVVIQMAIAPDSGVFGAWRDFVPGSYVGRKFKFRALLYSYNPLVTPVLDKFSFTIDMPDRLEVGTGVTISSGGTSIVYATPFQVTPNVQITINGATAGDDAILTSESASGFTIQIKNGGSGVARNVNWLAQGY